LSLDIPNLKVVFFWMKVMRERSLTYFNDDFVDILL